MSASASAASVYAAVGAELIHFALDVDTVELTRKGSIQLPSRVQYAWPHASLPVLYVSCADRSRSDRFFVSALRMSEDGELDYHGEHAVVESRPIHITTDADSRHVLTAYTHDPGLTVHRINDDGTIGERVPPVPPFDFGAYPHQIRVTPANNRAIIVARGYPLLPGRAYHPGALKFLSYDNGRVANLYTVNLEGSFGLERFNPRHLDFHPQLLFVSMEHQNAMAVMRLDGDDLDPRPLFVRNLLADPDNVRPRQLGGTVHVHPNGRYVYVANRNDSYEGFSGIRDYDSWTTPDPVPVFGGGENNIAVFELDEKTGEPTLIQNADTRGLFPRCFALDALGRVLIAANMRPTVIRDGSSVREVPASLAMFRVGSDGRLEFVRKYDIDVGRETIWWMGIVSRRRV